MVVVAKVGVLEEHGRVRTEEGTFAVRPADEGWFTVAGKTPEDSGRVRYDPDRSLLEIERPGVHVSVQFRPELERTVFTLDGHVYEIGTMDFGNISIHEGDRSVVNGHVTVSGARLVTVENDLKPIERELAFGLALRSSEVDKEFWKDDHLYSHYGWVSTPGPRSKGP